MNSNDPQAHTPFGVVSRRDVLKGAAAVAAAWSSPAQANPKHAGAMLAYVGAYTPNGQGIYLFSLDLSTGVLTQIKVAAMISNPSWIAIHPNGKYLYAVNEISNFNGTTSGSVTALAIDRSTGDLTVLNAVSSQGGGPAHLSVDPLGQFVFVANYGGGSVAVLPILANGSLGNATFVQVDVGSVGPTHATNAPPGSFAVSGHDAPHAHMIESDPAGNFVFSTDLGQDRIYSWTLNRGTGRLIANTPAFVSVPPGDGPRHFAFHPNGRFFYSIQEEASTLLVFDYDAAHGALTQKQMVSTLPPEFVGTNFTSEVRVSEDGKFVYGANRLHDSIGIFRVEDATGELTPVGEEWTRGDYPRSFTIDPTGAFLVSCNQRSDALTTYRVEGDGKTADLYRAVHTCREPGEHRVSHLNGASRRCDGCEASVRATRRKLEEAPAGPGTMTQAGPIGVLWRERRATDQAGAPSTMKLILLLDNRGRAEAGNRCGRRRAVAP